MTDHGRDHRGHRELRGKPPKQRSSAILRVFGSLIGWGIFFGLVAAAIASWGYLKFTSPGEVAQERVITIPKGLGRAEIASLLAEQEIISDATVFSAASAINGLRGRTLRPGEYSVPPNSSMRQVLALLNSGKVITYKLTIPEGWTTEMALGRIRENDVLQGDVTAAPAEGALVANTLLFERGTTRDQLVADMVELQQKLVDDLWQKRPADLPVKSKEEFVTLASIVEKETGVAAERPLVAAVFINRLKKGMRLQSDPTIIYGLVGGKGKLDRGISRADIDGATPYNTYQIDGLPPGPIAIPGADALRAVIEPAPVNYLYFVADGTGAHAFAETLEEHNANVRKWRKIEDQSQTPAAAVVPALAPTEPTQAATAPEAPVAADPPLNATGLDGVVPEPPPAPAPAAAPAASDTQSVSSEPAAPDPAVADTAPVLELKPGSVINTGNRLIPVPAERRSVQ